MEEDKQDQSPSKNSQQGDDHTESPENTEESTDLDSQLEPSNITESETSDEPDELSSELDAIMTEEGIEPVANEAAGEINAQMDSTLNDLDPGFKDELDTIASNNFDGVVIRKGETLKVGRQAKAKYFSIYINFLKNLPAATRKKLMLSGVILGLGFVISLLVSRGYFLPQFKFPYVVSMSELTDDVFNYPADGLQVPLFDDYRSKAFTFALPKATLNLRANGDEPAYGEFEFFLNLRDKDLTDMISKREKDILEIVRVALEDVSLKELETPLGKERVKKLIRYKINEYLEGNIVLSVYYRSVLLSR
jgi:flagellar basal body-associated protein FliL